jgi:predicted DNA binding CopG/RHH family protein
MGGAQNARSSSLRKENTLSVADTESSRLLTIRLSQNTHRALRIRVAEEDTSIQKYVEALIEKALCIAGETSEDKPSFDDGKQEP